MEYTEGESFDGGSVGSGGDFEEDKGGIGLNLDFFTNQF